MGLEPLASSFLSCSDGASGATWGHPPATSRARWRPSWIAVVAIFGQGLRRADFAVTQFFFRVEGYLRMVDDLARRRVDKPVIPGIMPVTNLRQVQRFAGLSGAEIPVELADRLHRVAADRPKSGKSAWPRPPSSVTACWTPACRACTCTP